MSGTEGQSAKKKTVRKQVFAFMDLKGIDLRCGAGLLGLQHATGMLPSALAFESLIMQNSGHPIGYPDFWHAIRDSNP